MNRLILALAISLAVAPAPAFSQDAPTPAQMEKAKKAFGEGKKFFEKGDFPEAIGKFKESYNLSKNPVLLYNIGFANESAGQDDIALFYYRKFLTDAPAEAAQRAEVTDRVKVLEKKFAVGPTTTTKPEVKPPVKAEPVKIKPPGTYGADVFQHAVVDAAPPRKALDMTAFVPEDSGFVVTLYFRTAGEGKFTSKVMRRHYNQLIGRVPPEKMLGELLQYYVEVKDAAGAVVTRVGKSTSPNLVSLEAGASAQFFPDFSDSEPGEASAGTTTTTAPATTGETATADDTDEDPLTGKKRTPPKKVAFVGGDDSTVGPETPAGGGFADVGSSKFRYVKWGATGGAAVMLGASIALYLSASNYATALEDDSAACGAPPCIKFDGTAADWESAGKRNQTLSNVTLAIGIGAAGIAGYYWYKELTAKKRGELKVSGGAASREMSWAVTPSIGDGFTGAAAAARF